MHLLENNSGVWVVMEAERAQDQIKRSALEGQFLRVGDYEVCGVSKLCLGDLDHFFGYINPEKLRVFLTARGSSSAAHPFRSQYPEPF